MKSNKETYSEMINEEYRKRKPSFLRLMISDIICDITEALIRLNCKVLGTSYDKINKASKNAKYDVTGGAEYDA